MHRPSGCRVGGWRNVAVERCGNEFEAVVARLQEGDDTSTRRADSHRGRTKGAAIARQRNRGSDGGAMPVRRLNANLHPRID
jgi:hypothetical protein